MFYTMMNFIILLLIIFIFIKIIFKPNVDFIKNQIIIWYNLGRKRKYFIIYFK